MSRLRRTTLPLGLAPPTRVLGRSGQARRPLVAAALVVLGAILVAPLAPSTPLPPGQAEAASPRPRDCPKRIGDARFQFGKEHALGPAGDLIDLGCTYYLLKGKGKGVASVVSIRLRYWTGESLPPHGDHPHAEPYCWRPSARGSSTTEPADGQALTPLEAAAGAPETKTNAGRAGIIYPVGDRFIWARYSATRKKAQRELARKAVIELAASLASEPSVGIATCPEVDQVTPTTPSEIDPGLDEMDPAATAYLAVVERFQEREAEADQMEEVNSRDLLATEAALGAAFLAHANAAEDFAAELAELSLPPNLKAEVDALIELVEQEAALWRIIGSEAPEDFVEAWSNRVARAQGELFQVTPAREDADALLRVLLGLE